MTRLESVLEKFELPLVAFGSIASGLTNLIIRIALLEIV